MSAASRWNDGKIHLGYTFTGTPSLATALLMQEGSTVFIAGVERALGESMSASWFGRGVVYVVDTQTLVDPETLWRRAQQVARLHDKGAAQHPGMRRYLAGQPPLERLAVDEAEEQTLQRRIVAAWRTPERHVSARAVADRLAEATTARDVSVIQGLVTGAGADGPSWRVCLSDGGTLRAPVVINCLWENRSVIDHQVRPSSEPTSIRYKRAVFGTAVTGLAGLSSSTRILGPYGDIAVYANGDAYLSWYPAGLAARSDDGSPPSVPDADAKHVVDATLAGLGLPTALLEAAGASWQLQGGFVVAWGRGDIDEPDSPLHERHRPDVHEVRPGFISVDTGKYTLAPLLAERAVERVMRSLASSSHGAIRA
jgi:hypothetical protein